MYIPSIVLTLIIILIIALWEKRIEKERQKLIIKHNEEMQRWREDWDKQYKNYLKSENKLKIMIVSVVFNCPILEATKKFNVLKQTCFDTEFIFAESNEERIHIYNSAISELNKQE